MGDHFLLRTLLTTAALVAFVGCGSSSDGFVSDDPNEDHDGYYGDAVGATNGATGSGSGGGSTGAGGSNVVPDDPERTIVEADVVQVHGDKLYALSEFSGLTIIDVSNPSEMRILGRRQLGGQPFEMYRVGDVVYAMFRGWGRYDTVEGGGWQWVTSSHVEALDVSSPQSITTIGSLEVPGWISDSRMVGDVLYTVSLEDGYCWGCGSSGGTTVSSFATSNPSSLTKLDELALPTGEDSFGWTRSIAVTDERIYVGGREWSNDANGASSITVVDISDPAGDLVLGAKVPIAGQITSRWQMDEHAGVLRVISQPWGADLYPEIETFAITSSAALTPLAKTPIVLPKPESLRTVRFDGTRAFAITAEQIDPLFTIDLSDPALPVVRGELAMPGWVYHIEPRGDRLLALGYDAQNPDGALNVSLFDVSDLGAPALVRRVAFGQGWGNFAEDQDRIHKAFNILPDLGLLLVPYSAWAYSEVGCSSYDSGIQLVDWANDDLVKRGVAPVRGEAKRAFVHDGTLFGMSDEQVRAFDLADRDALTKVGQLALSVHVSQVQIAGQNVARLSADWWTSEPRLEIVPLSDPSSAEPLGALDLGAMLGTAEGDASCYGWSYWSVRMFAHGDAVYLVWPSYTGSLARVATVDISDPSRPALRGHVDVPMNDYSGYGYYYESDQLVAQGDPVVQVGDQLVFQQIDPRSYEDGVGLPRGGRLTKVDLSDAAHPQVSSIDAPVAAGHTGLVRDGNRVLFSHWVPVDGMPGKVRFYFDRVDVGTDTLSRAEPINVPGSLVSYDRATRHLLSVDYVRRTKRVDSWTECEEAFGWAARYEADELDAYGWSGPGTCTILDRSLSLTEIDEDEDTATLLDARAIESHDWVSNIVVGEDRMFFTTSDYQLDGYSSSRVYAVGGLADGELQIGSVALEDMWWQTPIAASGTTLVAASMGALITIDTSDLDAIHSTRIGDLPWWVESAKVQSGRVFLSMGPYGLVTYELP